MPNIDAFDYLTNDNLCIEWNRPSGTHTRRLSLIKAALDMYRITKDCSDFEKKLIMSAVKNKKNSIRRGNTDD